MQNSLLRMFRRPPGPPDGSCFVATTKTHPRGCVFWLSIKSVLTEWDGSGGRGLIPRTPFAAMGIEKRLHLVAGSHHTERVGASRTNHHYASSKWANDCSSLWPGVDRSDHVRSLRTTVWAQAGGHEPLKNLAANGNRREWRYTLCVITLMPKVISGTQKKQRFVANKHPAVV
jgi:hypothetical protein